MVSLKSQTGLLFSKGPSAVPLNVGECTIWLRYVSCGMSHFFLVAFEKLSPKTTIKDRAGINIQEKSTLIHPEPWASFVKVTSFSLSFPQFMCYSFVFCSFSQFQPDFLFRDLSWHFTNTTESFPFCRRGTFSLEQKITFF